MILTKRNIEKFNPYCHFKELLGYIAEDKDAIVFGFSCYNLEKFTFVVDDIQRKMKGFLSNFTYHAGMPYWYGIGYSIKHIPYTIVADSEKGDVQFIIKKKDIEEWERTILNEIQGELKVLVKVSKKVGLDYEIAK